MENVHRLSTYSRLTAGQKKAPDPLGAGASVPLVGGVSALFLTLSAAVTEALVETVDTATAVYNFLLTSEERVTVGTHVYVEILTQG